MTQRIKNSRFIRNGRSLLVGAGMWSICLAPSVLPVNVLLGMNAQADCPSCPKVILLTGDLEYRRLPGELDTKGWNDVTVCAEEAFGRSFTATVPGLALGRYTVEVDLVEIVHREEGRRRMEIANGFVPLVRNLDVLQTAGGFAKACRLQCPVERAEAQRGQPLVLNFRGQPDAAMFCALRLRNAAGAVIASLTADELRAAEPLGVERIPDIASPPLYPDPAQPVDQRVDDLIRRMSLQEKVAQLLNDAPGIERLGVPPYDYWNECLHGVARAGIATVFPQAIGMAATWDPGLVHEIAEAIATEARAKHHDAVRRGIRAIYFGLTFWSPNINLFRDPRWGRGQETYGEDPFLTGRMAVAFITGLQGDDPRYFKALACAKHFAVHSGPESLRHTFDAEPSAQDLYDSYLPHFEAAVREAHVGSVMSAYNRLYGDSASSSPLLLTKLLRQQWGFAGYVVSDCDAVADIWLTHHVVATPEEAAARAIKAGCDLNCGSQYYALGRAVKKGLLTEADIDRALRRIFTYRFRLGMFDPDALVPYARIPMSEVDSPAHAALALQTAQESVVLLKNTGVLPLDRARVKRLAVIGANADSVAVLLGNYNGTPSHPVTILQGLKEAAGPGVEVVTAPGCPLALKTGEHPDPQSPDFRRALDLARASDAVIYVGGISPDLEGEEMQVNYEDFNGGDRTRIELPAIQTHLLQALHATGKPVIFVNCSGSAIAMPWEAWHLPAILQAWYPGEAGGTAVARILFGDCNPSGRLPVTFYRSTEDLPPFEDYAMANRTYRFFTGRPLFAFGHGLSYTAFSYGPARLDAAEVRADGIVRLSVELINRGGRDGDEIVQVYARRNGAADSHLPRQRLCAFQRVQVAKGQQVVVQLAFPAAALRRWNVAANAYTVDAGEYELQVGASSADIRQSAQIRIVP